MMEALPTPPAAIALDRRELALLAFTADLLPDDESPLGRVSPLAAAADLERASAGLLERRLLAPKSLRADRELLRRLLVVARPDARIVVTDHAGGVESRPRDLCFRAGVYVAHSAADGRHHLGPPRELEDVVDDLLSLFRARRSTGDFVDLSLTVPEYLAFSLLAQDLAERQRALDAETQRTPLEPTTVRNPVPRGASDEGTPIRVMLQRFPESEPTAADLAASLSGLVEKGLAERQRDRHAIRPYFQDLAIGLATKQRTLVARIDFTPEDWLARDATFVSVPGSIFLVRANHKQRLRIVELDTRGLTRAIRSVVSPLEEKA